MVRKMVRNMIRMARIRHRYARFPMLRMLRRKGVSMSKAVGRLVPVVTCVADEAGMAAFAAAGRKRLAADESHRLAAADRAFWSDPDVERTPGEIKALIWDVCMGKCVYCGRIMNPFRDFSIDHKTPKARGGTDDISNLVGCCLGCNRRKHTRTAEEFVS